MDANTVKKTEEIRKQAETELGIVSTTPALPDFLPGLNIGPAFPGIAPSTKRVRPLHCSMILSGWLSQLPKIAPSESRMLPSKGIYL